MADLISDFENWPIQDGGSKMADPIIGYAKQNRVKLATQGFSGLLITNSISDFES